MKKILINDALLLLRLLLLPVAVVYAMLFLLTSFVTACLGIIGFQLPEEILSRTDTVVQSLWRKLPECGPRF